MIWIVLELWVTFGKTANLHQMSSEDLCVWDVFALLVLSSRVFFGVSEFTDQVILRYYMLLIYLF